jgi:hypothetical protein
LIKTPFVGFCLVVACLAGLPTATEAKTYTWSRAGTAAERAQAMQTNQTITITGSLYWGSGSWDSKFVDGGAANVPMGNGIAAGINASNQKAASMADVCKNPALSESARTTTGASPNENRWLTAQEVFNAINMANLYQAAARASGAISVIVDGKSYLTFKVTYADGASERWAINPGHNTSVVKLFDAPIPDTLSKGNKQGC